MNASLRLALTCLLLATASECRSQTVSVTAFVSDARGRPLEGAAVFVSASNVKYPPPEQPYVMDQINKELVPHILPILVGGRVRFPNKDNIYHHIYSFSPAKTFELPLYKGEPASPVLFDRPGIVRLGCNIHDWMSGYILVLPTPYVAFTDARGQALLSLPRTDEVELSAFHELQYDSMDETRKKVSLAGKDAVAVHWTLRIKVRQKPVRRDHY